MSSRPIPVDVGIVNFSLKKGEQELVTQIAKRAVKMAKEADIEYDQKTADMDITACHCNGCPLDLKKLLSAPDADFGHDVFGIRKFIDRNNGKLESNFFPRCHA